MPVHNPKIIHLNGVMFSSRMKKLKRTSYYLTVSEVFAGLIM